jgi:hypothetical protein
MGGDRTAQSAQRGVRFPAGVRDFLFCQASRPTLDHTQPHIRRAVGAISLGVKRPGREADHSPPLSSKVKNGGAIPPLLIRLRAAVLN